MSKEDVKIYKKYYLIAQKYKNKNNFKTAIKYYNLALSLKKDFADAYYGRALCMRYFDKRKALLDFESAFRYNRKFTDRGKYYYGLINFYLEQNKLNKALKLTEKSGKSSSSQLPWEEKEYLIRKALIFALLRKYNKAIETLKELKDLMTNLSHEISGVGFFNTDFFYSNYDLLLGNVYLVTGEKNKAYTVFNNALKSIENANFSNKEIEKYNDYILIPLYLFLNNKEKALNRVKLALKRHKDKGYFYSWYAAYAKKYVNDKIALKILNKARKNGYINEGILKSDILQGYFLKGVMGNKIL